MSLKNTFVKIKEKIPDEMKTPLKVLLFSIILVIIISIFDPEKTIRIVKSTLRLIITLLPSLFMVWGLMILFNLFVSPQRLAKLLGKEKKGRAAIISAVAGIISSGPIYLWYPLLAEAKEKGASYSSITIFLYNRAVKPALIPLLIYYFGIRFTITLMIVMILMSFVQGIIIEWLLRTEELIEPKI